MAIAFLLVILAAIGVGLVAQHRATRRFRIGEPPMPRLPAPARRARYATLDECQAGDHVAVLGRIVSADDLAGPLSGRPCVAYDLGVIDAETGQQVGRSVRAQPFVVEDHGRRAAVDATSADLRLWHDRPTFLFDGPQLAAIAALTGAPPNRPVYAYEGRLTRGQGVLVIGLVQDVETSGGAAYRSAPAAASVAITSSDEVPLVVSDRLDDRDQLVGPATTTIRV